MKIKHGISFVISFMMILSMLSICPVKAETLASEGLSNNAPSEKDIVDYLKSHDISKDYEETFATPFTTRESKSSYDVSDAGALSDASQQKALTYLNTMRFIAGVDPVKLSSDLESKAQCSAYVNYLNDEPTHYPVKTDAMSQELFDKADNGSQNGNIGSSSASYESSVKSRNLEYEIDGWLSDSNKKSNWEAVGHRRWSLDPKLSAVGFGKAYGVRLNNSRAYSGYATMTYDYDKRAKKSQKGLSWPAAQMPVGFFNNKDVWSYLSVDGLEDNNITVTLTRTKSSDGAGQKTWTMTKTANDDGVVYTSYARREGAYTFDIVGHTDAVIFKPNNMDIHAGDVYNVKITGVGKTVDYDVSFFDPDNVSTESNPVTKINLDQSILNSDNQLALTKGESYDLTKYISIEPSDADNQDLSYSSSDENVATCTDGTIEALTAGETTITVKSTNDVTLTIPVKVTDQETAQTVSVPKGKTYTYDGEEHEVSLPDHVVYADDRDSDKTATNAGDYTYYVKPEDGYTWEDGTTDEQEIEWSITKADNSAETFEADDVTYPEKPSVKAQLKYLDDDKEIMYKEENASDDEYSTEVPTTPGTYIVKVSSEGNDNVNDFKDEKTFTIHKGTIDTSNIVMEDQHATYDGQDHSKDMQLSGTNINDSVTLTITNQDDEQVEEAIEPGSYKVTATIHRDYYKDATKTATLTITKKDADENEWISPLTISDDITYGDDYRVNAESKYGDVTYTYKDENGSVLSEKPTDAGTYTVIAQVEGTKEYTSLKDEKTFTIKRKQVAIPEITKSFTYDGKEHRVCEDGDHYHVIYATQTMAGSYHAELVLDSDNYEWSDGTTYSKDIYWTIAKADNSAETFDVNDVTYPEKTVVNVKLKYLDDNKKIEYKEKDASDDTYTTTLPTQPGTYCVRVTCQGSDNVNTFEKTMTFTIFKETMNTSDFTFNDVNVPYDCDDHIHDVKVTGLQNGDQVSYDITDENGEEVTSAKDPGTYHYKATIHRDHHDDVYLYATLTISKLTNEWYGPIYASSDDIRYGDDYNFSAYSRYGNTEYRYEDENGNELYEKPTEAGTYKVIATVEGTSIYTGLEAEKTFTINPKKVAIPESQTFTYDGQEHSIDESEGFNVLGSAVNAGTYSAEAYLENDNYIWSDGTTDSKSINWTITKADNSAETFEVNDVTYPDKPSVDVKLKYLDDDKKIEYKEENASDDEYSTEVPTTPGTYTVRVSSEGNDNVNDFEDEKTFTIHKGTIDTSNIVMKDQNVTYDGQDHSKDMQLSGTDINDSVTLTITNQSGEQVEEAIEPGSYKVTATIHRDYYKDATKTATLTITKKDADENEWISPLTISDDITYGDDYRVNAESKYGNVTYTYNDENGSVLSEKPTNAGTYTVTAQVEGTKEYTSLKDEKTFTIKRKQVAIPEITKSFTYDGKEHRVCEDGDYYYLYYAPQTSAGLHYSLLVLTSNNYEWSDGTTDSKEIYWTITKADNSAETFDVNDVTYPEKPVVDVKLKYLDDDKKIEYKEKDASDDTYTTTLPTQPGTYCVRVTCQGSDNVNTFKTTKTFTIYNATLDASGFEMSNQTVTYDGADHSHDVQVTGTDSNDEVSYEITDENGDEVASAIEPGVYNIRATIHRDNYDDAYKYATLTIIEKDQNKNAWTTPLTISSDDITYGDNYKVNAESKYGDVTYTYKDEYGDVLSEKPTQAGTYTVIASVEGTSQYTGLSNEMKFTIKRKKVAVPEITSHFTYDGKEHRACKAGDYYYLSPASETAAGSYCTLLVLNSNYEWSDGTTYSRYIYWTIAKADNSAETFDVNDVTYPEKPVVDVKLKYLDDYKEIKYKEENASDDTYTTTLPTQPGTYYVRVTCQDSGNVNAFKTTKTFTIFKGTMNTSDFTFNDVNVPYDGDDHIHDAKVTGLQDEDQVSYKITDENGDEVASAIEPGVYNICATIHRDNYDDVYKYATLTITETGTSTGNTETGTSTGNTGTGTSPGNTGSTSTGNTGTGAPNGNTGTGAPTDNTGTGTPTGNTETGTPTDNTETNKPVDNTESKGKKTPIVQLSTTQAIDRMVTTLKGDRDISGSKFGLLQAKGMKVTKSSIKVQWKKIKGAKGYIVYGNKCGKKYQKLKSVKGLSWTQRKLKKGTYYKYMVVAYNAKGMAIAYSKTIHVTTLGGKKANPKNIKLKSHKKLTLKVNKKAKIKASYVLAKKAKMSNHRGLAYESSNTKVARVSKKGQITAKKKGVCTIYVYGQNGTMNKVQVKVQ